jgi:hypothetical protein
MKLLERERYNCTAKFVRDHQKYVTSKLRESDLPNLASRWEMHIRPHWNIKPSSYPDGITHLIARDIAFMWHRDSCAHKSMKLRATACNYPIP